MKRQQRFFKLSSLLAIMLLMIFAFNTFGGTMRGRVDYQAPNGYFPLPNALVEVWGFYPNGQQFMVAWTRTDQWGFYYLTLPAYNGQVQVWVNKAVFQPVVLNVAIPHVDVVPILAQ